MAVVSEEAVERVAKQAEMGTTYLVLMSTAGVLAAVALLTNSVPVLIGAMIVAPAFAPLALVAFALAGGNTKLGVSRVGCGGCRPRDRDYLCNADDLDHECLQCSSGGS